MPLVVCTQCLCLWGTSKELQSKTRQVAALRKADRIKNIKLNKLANAKDKEQVRHPNVPRRVPTPVRRFLSTHPGAPTAAVCQVVLTRKLEKARDTIKRLQAKLTRRAEIAKSRAERGSVWTAVGAQAPTGDSAEDPAALDGVFHLVRVAETGHHVPRTLAMALQAEVNKRWKRER